MVTKKPGTNKKPLKNGDVLPRKTVKNLPKNFFYLFNDFSDKTIEDWVKRKVCFGDKTLYKYISEYSRENIKKFRTRVHRLYPNETFDEAAKVLVTESIRPLMYDIIDDLTKFLKPMGDLIISGGEAVNFHLTVNDRVITSDIDTKFVPKMKPDDKYFGKLQAVKLLLWNKLGEIAQRDNYKIINKVITETDQYFNENKFNYSNNSSAVYRTNWAYRVAKYIGLATATGKGSKGYHVTRRYSLMPKRKNVKGGSNVLIDVELFTLDMKFRLVNTKTGKLEDQNFGGILDIAFMRPKQLGYNIAKANFSGGTNMSFINQNRNLSYIKKYKYLSIPTKHYLIEDIYMMQKLGLRPDPAKKEKNRKRMVLLARQMSKKKILSTDSMDTIAKKVGIKLGKPAHTFRTYTKVGPSVIKKATKINPQKYKLSTTAPSKPKLSKDIFYGLKANHNEMKTPPNYLRTQSNHIFNMEKMNWIPNPNQNYVRNEMNFRPIKPRPLPSKINNVNMEETLYGFKPIRDQWVPKPLLEKSAMIPFIGLKK